MQVRPPIESYLRLDQPLGCEVADPLLAHHEVEHAVWRELQAIPGVHFPTLIVRRTRDGLCLQGVMETEETSDGFDVDGLVRQVADVQTVVNQLLVRRAPNPSRIPR